MASSSRPPNHLLFAVLDDGTGARGPGAERRRALFDPRSVRPLDKAKPLEELAFKP